MMSRREDIEKVGDELAKKMADEGRLIEAGFLGLMAAAYPDGVPDNQRKEIRQAFFCGSQHLFSSIMRIMDEGVEPTANDVNKMDLIDQELEGWLHQFMHDNNITDPDIGPTIGEKH